MAVTVLDGIVRMTATGDDIGGAGDPISVQSITLTGDSAATTGTEVEIQNNAGTPVTLFTLRALPHTSETVLFWPAKQFGAGINILLSSAGGVPAGDDEVTVVLA